MRCLEKRAADRWQRADELVEQLEGVLTPSGGMTPAQTLPLHAVVPARRRLTIMLAGAVLAVAGIAFLVRGWNSSGPKVERLAVLPFENRTGKPEHDQLGVMVADWVSRGLVDARLAEVIPTSVAMQAVTDARAAKQDLMRTLVDLTGATKVVTGAYYAVGDSIRFQAELVEADHRHPSSRLTR